jgi:hypothetical protein
VTTSYLDQVRQGKNEWWRYLVGIITILVFWFGLGSACILIPIMWSAANASSTGNSIQETPSMVELMGVPPALALGFFLLSFVPMLVGVLFVIRFIHQRPALSLITPHPRINWWRLGQGFLIYAGLALLAALVEALLYPGRYQFSLNLAQFLPFLLVGLLLIPLQTTAEELLFRGYLLQGISLFTKNLLTLAVISGIVFAIPHLANPEIEAGPWLLATSYFVVGFGLGLVSLRDNGLELAIGVHAANNLLSLVANYPDSALPVASIFTVALLDPVYALISTILIYIAFYLIIFRVGSKYSPESSILDQKPPDVLGK